MVDAFNNKTFTAPSRGVGKHIWANPPDTLYFIFLMRFAAQLCYNYSVTLTKLSLLAFYHRSFGVWRSARISIWVVGIILVLWSTVLVGLITQLCGLNSHSPMGTSC